MEVPVGSCWKKLLELTSWELLNINNDDAMTLRDQVFKLVYPEKDYPQNQAEREAWILKCYSEYQAKTAPFTIGKVGLHGMFNWLEDINENQECPDTHWAKGRVPHPRVYVSAAVHYSIPKALSLLGLGEDTVHKLPVDKDTRLCMKSLRHELQYCLDHHIPVLAVTGIVGTTEESGVDPLDEIFKLKEEFTKKGLYFHFHIDSAYGGYFVSMTRNRF